MMGATPNRVTVALGELARAAVDTLILPGETPATCIDRLIGNLRLIAETPEDYAANFGAQVARAPDVVRPELKRRARVRLHGSGAIGIVTNRTWRGGELWVHLVGDNAPWSGYFLARDATLHAGAAALPERTEGDHMNTEPMELNALMFSPAAARVLGAVKGEGESGAAMTMFDSREKQIIAMLHLHDLVRFGRTDYAGRPEGYWLTTLGEEHLAALEVLARYNLDQVSNVTHLVYFLTEKIREFEMQLEVTDQQLADREEQDAA